MVEKNNKVVVRESNYELMRIISMFFIVIYHILVHGKLLEHATGTTKILLIILESIILVHVNSFIMITGYFQSKSKFKLGNIISINNQVWFYKVFMMIILLLCGIATMPDIVSIYQTLFPIDFGSYWYIGCYIVLYLISPILNKVIENSTQKELKKYIGILFIIISIASTFSHDVFFNAYSGRSISTFILLYFIGAYIRNYPINDSYIMKLFTVKAKRLIYLLGFWMCVVLSFFCWETANQLSELNPLIKYLGVAFNYLHASYASPILIFQTIFYFLYFGTLTIKSRFINYIAKHTLGIYLISENYFLRINFYNKIGLTAIEIINMKVLGTSLILSILMFVIPLFIEIIRKKFFEIIYNSKLAIKNRKWYREKIESLGLKINW